MQNSETGSQGIQPNKKPDRLHYLDWLCVLAILGVFFFHPMHPFDATQLRPVLL